MAESVYEVLKSNHPRLVAEVLDKSEELSKFLMLVYSHVLYTATEQAGDPRDLYFEYSINEMSEGSLIKIDMKYKEREGSKLGSMDGKNPVKRNLSLVRLLQSNSNCKDIAIKVVDILERWIAAKPYRKECGLLALKFENVMFWKNLIFTAEILLHVEWEQMVRLKANFPDDDLFVEHPMVSGGYLI